ncbi:MAG: FG-GAP-like repeat-containing protein [Lacunisphaera sp.]|nr:FG-GAP-like repeat-containing protein [Lacunisphaera sp.]
MKTSGPSVHSRRLRLRQFFCARALLPVFALAAFAVTTRLSAQVPTFNTVIVTATGSQPWQNPTPAAVGDFNGDGKLDAMIADSTSALRYLRGNGDGTFTRSDIGLAPMTTANTVGLPASLVPYLPVNVDGYLRAKAADLNGDGRLDVVLTMGVHINWGPFNGLTVALNTGNDANGVPQFTTTHNFYNVVDVRSFTAGDLNGDGRADFITGFAYGQLAVYLSNSDGTLSAGQATGLSFFGASVAGGAIGDLNGDGKADFVVTTGQGNGTTDVFFGNGDGTLQAPVSIATDYATAVALADVNKDGALDIVRGSGAGLVSVSLNNGHGSFGSPTFFATVGSGGVTGFFMSDVNGDGNVDAAMSLTNGQVVIALGNGDGTFGNSYAFGGIPVAQDVTLADFTGDGKVDIGSVSAAGYGGQTFRLLTNTTPFPPPVPPAVLFFTDSLATDSTSPNVATPAGKYTKIASGLQRINNSSGGGDQSSNTDRPIVTTVLGTYLLETQFTAEVTVDLVSPDLAYFGFGQSLPDPNYFGEPTNGFVFRVHNNWTGYSGIQAWPTQFGSSPNNADHFFGFPGVGLPANYGGPVTLKIQRNGDTLTMSVPSQGASKSFSISQYQAQMGLTGTNARIFFGSTNNGTVFSNLKIYQTAPDTTAPVITSPGDITREATSASGAVVTFTATAADDKDGPVPVLADPSSGSTFPLGTTIVVLGAADAAHNASATSFTITVQDTIAPILIAPENQVLEATDATGTVATFSAITSDAVGVTSTTYSAASGSKFPLGTTTVNVTASDAAGHSTSGSFTVTVRDTIAPNLTVPANQVREATGPAGATASFTASATDAVGVSSISYSTASGSTFPIGTTTVNVTATDAAGNATSGSFTVTVRDTIAPSLTGVTPSSATLWPPNHQMVPISIAANAGDLVGITSLKIVSVQSSEPDNGLGDGDTANDTQITGALTVNLRAERSGNGNGRTYTITVEAKDAAGNTTTATTTVSVPKSQGGKK